MKIILKKTIHLYFLFVSLAVVQGISAQDNFGVKYFGLSIHPKGEKDNAFLMPRRFDNKGYFVLNVGGVVSYEHFFFKDIFSVKIAQALYSDCAARLGGFSHIGIRGKIFSQSRHSLHGGIGPTIVFRSNWLEMEGYKNPNRFKGDADSKWQHLFLWYGGEFEYKYRIKEKIDLTASFIPGYPDLMSLSFGLNINLD